MKPSFIYFLICIVTGGVTLACHSTDQNSLEGYYIPDQAENDGIVYEFKTEGFKEGKEYWYYNLRETSDSTHLIVTVYDEQFNQQQLSVEKELSNGWIQQQLLLFFLDSTQTRSEKVTIHTGNRFVFDLQDSLDVVHYSIEWEESLDGKPVTKRLFRNSRFMGYDTLSIMGDSQKAAHFVSRDKIEDDREGTLTLDLRSDEYYVKDWGLVEKYQYYQKGDSEILMRHLILIDTLRMTDLENKLKEIR